MYSNMVMSKTFLFVYFFYHICYCYCLNINICASLYVIVFFNSRGNPEEITKRYYDTKSSYKKIRNEVSQRMKFIEASKISIVYYSTSLCKIRKTPSSTLKYFFKFPFKNWLNCFVDWLIKLFCTLIQVEEEG